MVRNLAELRATSDEELVQEHDRTAQSTVVGTAYYVDELNRRSQERTLAAARRLTKLSLWIGGIGILLASTNTVLAVVAIRIALRK